MKTEKRDTVYIKNETNGNTIKNNRFEISGVESNSSTHHISNVPKVSVKLLQFIFVTIILLITPLISSAQLPNLGTAADFAIFTTAGALDNTGTSNITGNIGTNLGAITGFGAPTVVNGTIEPANLVTAQCALDVQAAYNEILATAPTVVGHAPAFGSGETLTVGVYFIGAAGSVAGNLTLDAEGDPAAIFIFQFGGAFDTGTATTINLINGAAACNVFWIAEGAIAMAAITDMKGTLISNNGAISMGAGGTLEGRMLSTTGAAAVYDDLITLPLCAAAAAPLPISLQSFAGYCDKQNIVLQWTTATEINNDYFTIDRSQDGINWHFVETVSGAGNSSTPHNYKLVDMTFNDGTTYYRLKQTDFNGQFEYAKTIAIVYKCKEDIPELIIYPNPSVEKFNLLFSGEKSNVNSIEIYNMFGEKVYYSDSYQSNISFLDNKIGIYFVYFHLDTQTITKKIVVTAQ